LQPQQSLVAVRHDLRGKRHRAPAHQTEPSVNQRSGREDEPDNQESDHQRFHYDSNDQLRTHLTDFMAAYNFARQLKTLSGLTPYEYITRIWTSEPDRFTVNPIQQMPGLNT
jgi:hypothetical protein